MTIENVVLLHGSLGSGSQWSAVERALAPACRTFAPDLLGPAGAPQFAVPAAYDVALEVDAALRAIDARFGPRADFHLVGHGYGGVVALEFARRHASRVRGATLYEPSLFGLLEDADDRDFIARLLRAVELLVARRLDAGAARMYHDFWNGPGAFDALDAEARDTLAAGAPKLLLELKASCCARGGAGESSTHGVPVHLVGGTRSFLITRRVLDRLAGGLRHATLAWIDGDHHSPVTDPARFIEVLRARIDDLRGRRAVAARAAA